MKNRFLIVFAFALAIAVSPSSADAQKKPQPTQTAKTPEVKSLAPLATNAPNQTDTYKVNNSKTAEKYVPSPKEQEIIDEINALRKDPKGYIKYLEEFKKMYKGNIVYLPTYVRVQTIEGTTAVDEAIEFLKTAPAVEPLSFSNGLNKASVMQLGDLIENSSLGHTSRDGSDLTKRLAKFGKSGLKAAENIGFYFEIPRNIVLQMIIDDGVKTRHHRKNILNSSFKLAGISFARGKTGEGLTVIVFSDSFKETSGGGSLGVIEM
jgi:uncharacterized protein YkwD